MRFSTSQKNAYIVCYKWQLKNRAADILLKTKFNDHMELILYFFFPCRLPGHVLFSEEPLIARWDYKKKYWRQDGFTDMSYDEGRFWSL